MRVLIVDDEPPARKRLARMVAELPGVEVAGEAQDGEEALEQIAALTPDLVLLDIRMPKLDGLTLAQRATELPKLIFVTAHDEFAVQAFEVNAVDYLLKPVRPERLAAAIERARTRGPQREQVTQALNAVKPVTDSRVVSASRGVVRFFDAKEICRFWASEKYTLFRAGGEEQLTEESLSQLEARLAAYGFLRVHRGELVHLPSVRALRTEDGIHEVELADGQRAQVSRRSLPEVKRALGRG